MPKGIPAALKNGVEGGSRVWAEGATGRPGQILIEIDFPVTAKGAVCVERFSLRELRGVSLVTDVFCNAKDVLCNWASLPT
jgi:hypothetical protein